MVETGPKPFVFVLMPLDSAFSDIYHHGIKEACQEAGAYCERVDEQNFMESILERVYNQISKADIIVADMTGRNANVFYEVGYAHALGKRVILLTQKADDIPFDLKHYPHVIYEGKIRVLKPQVESKVRWCISNPIGLIPKIDSSLEFFLGKTPLTGTPEIKASCWEHADEGGETAGWMELEIRIDIHNSGNRIADPDSFDLALICPMSLYPDQRGTSEIRSEMVVKKTRILRFRKLAPLFPDAWDRLTVELRFDTEDFAEQPSVALRLFTELGPIDYPFTLKFVRMPPVPPLPAPLAQ